MPKVRKLATVVTVKEWVPNKRQVTSRFVVPDIGHWEVRLHQRFRDKAEAARVVAHWERRSEQEKASDGNRRWSVTSVRG